MLSYLHSYHAGNFADVHKHILLSRVFIHLQQKDTPYCYLETHAGRGIYNLTSAPAVKTGEAAGGIGKIWPCADAPAPVQAYLDCVRTLNEKGALRIYPGSPKLAQQMLRGQDRMILMEMHPAEFPQLSDCFRVDRRVFVQNRDGYEGLNAQVPPREKRGAVLIDPSYEIKREYNEVVEVVAKAHAKWPGGIYVVWYPLLPDAHHHSLARRFERSGLRKILCCELRVRENSGHGMYGSGVLVINPPWPLRDQMLEIQPWLMEKMAVDAKVSQRVEWLVGE